MRRIRSMDTKPELLLRRELFRRGLRYRIHVRDLPGKPDILFRRPRLAVFVHGCFWHQHPNCIQASSPRTNVSYWAPKLARNQQCDKEHEAALQRAGYNVITFWECAIEKDVSKLAKLIERAVKGVQPTT